MGHSTGSSPSRHTSVGRRASGVHGSAGGHGSAGRDHGSVDRVRARSCGHVLCRVHGRRDRDRRDRRACRRRSCQGRQGQGRRRSAASKRRRPPVSRGAAPRGRLLPRDQPKASGARAAPLLRVDWTSRIWIQVRSCYFASEPRSFSIADQLQRRSFSRNSSMSDLFRVAIITRT
jgi:hypothetical protein